MAFISFDDERSSIFFKEYGDITFNCRSQQAGTDHCVEEVNCFEVVCDFGLFVLFNVLGRQDIPCETGILLCVFGVFQTFRAILRIGNSRKA